MKRTVGYVLASLVAALVIAAFLADLVVLPALARVWSTELLVLAMGSLTLAAVFGVARWLIELAEKRSGRHRATSKS